jgi:signal peptidase I
MFSFLLPKYVKQGQQFAKDARKILDYKRDIWDKETVEQYENDLKILETGCKERNSEMVEKAAKSLNERCMNLLPKAEDAAWRENCEVFLVAIVVALAVRTFFLQPFTIPTGSMQPTLNGILGHETAEEPPNGFVRLWDTAIRGRTWLNVIAEDDETAVSVQEVSRFFFFTYTRIDTNKGHTYWVHAPERTLLDFFHLYPLRSFRRGEVMFRGYVDTGDHVFVDKISYQFRKPHRGDVFVFNTERLPTIDRRHDSFEPNNPAEFDWPALASLADQWGKKVDMSAPSQFYIKRLVALPDDQLRIDAPRLYVNGQLAQGFPFERVMAGTADHPKDGYKGYGFGNSGFLAPILRASDDTFVLPPKHYMAMGDNSYSSSDSRDWGPVPQQNIMGKGLFVYWPFGPHWGFIR